MSELPGNATLEVQRDQMNERAISVTSLSPGIKQSFHPDHKIVTFQEDVTFKRSSVGSTQTKPTLIPRRFATLKGTKMLFVVTSLFYLSWLPFWILKFANIGHPGLWEDQSSSGELLYAFLNHLYFINNAINPLIYTFANYNFREDCRQVFRRIRCRRINIL